MSWLLLNLLLAAPFVAIWTGVPLWLVFKHPDQGPPAPSGTRLPAVGVNQPGPRRPRRARRPATRSHPLMRQA